MTRRQPRQYGRNLALTSLPFWLVSVGCLVYGLANELVFTTICAAVATAAFPFMVWRRWDPPGSERS